MRIESSGAFYRISYIDTLYHISEAVEGLPGNRALIGIEEAAVGGEKPNVDLLAFLLDPAPDEVVDETTPHNRTAEGERQTTSDAT